MSLMLIFIWMMPQKSLQPPKEYLIKLGLV